MCESDRASSKSSEPVSTQSAMALVYRPSSLAAVAR